jgi:hypothetical protein
MLCNAEDSAADTVQLAELELLKTRCQLVFTNKSNS